MDITEAVNNFTANHGTISFIAGFIVSSIASGTFEEIGSEYIYTPIKEKIRSLVKGEELLTLNKFLDTPDSPSLQEKATKILETRLTENPQVADELAQLIKQLPASAQTNINFQSGESNINIQGNQDSTINFNQK